MSTIAPTRANGPARGLRLAGRIFAFYLIAFAAVAIPAAVVLLTLRVTGHHPRFAGIGHLPTTLTVRQMLPGELVAVFGFVVALLVMARRERRTLADYGFPWRTLFARPLWAGAGSGLLAIVAVMGAMLACGSAHVVGTAPIGPSLFAQAALWAVTMLFVGLSEELGFRSYPIFASAQSTGFWRGAVISTAIFAGFHLANQGETPVGIASVLAVGFLFCFALRRFGDLRWPIGFHAAWDWGQTALFGTQDSGLYASGSILRTQTAGPALISGGSAGPEATVFALVVLAFTAYLIHLRTSRP